MGRIAEYFSLLFSCIPCRAASIKVVPLHAKSFDDDSVPNAAGSVHANDDDSDNASSSPSLHCAADAGKEPSSMKWQEQNRQRANCVARVVEHVSNPIYYC